MGLFSRRKKEEEVPAMQQPVQEAAAPVADDQAEIVAAISVALNLYLNKSREMEEAIITIQKVIKPYSPWNSKIYNLKQMPYRHPQPRIKKL